jgi:hypothetical protein
LKLEKVGGDMKTTLLLAGLLMIPCVAGADEWADRLSEQLRESQRDSDRQMNRLNDDFEREESQRLQREEIEIERRQLIQRQNDSLDESLRYRYR